MNPYLLPILLKEVFIHALSCFAAMTTPGTQVAEINLQPSQARDYRAYVPVRLGSLTTAAFIDSSNNFANAISPQMMVALGISPPQLEPVPQLSVGTATAGKWMKILGQTPRIDLQLGQHLAKFRIRPLVLQGLVHPVNICGPFLARAGIDQIHSTGVLGVCGKEVPMCTAATTRTCISTSSTSTFPWHLYTPCSQCPDPTSAIHTQRSTGGSPFGERGC